MFLMMLHTFAILSILYALTKSKPRYLWITFVLMIAILGLVVLTQFCGALNPPLNPVAAQSERLAADIEFLKGEVARKKPIGDEKPYNDLGYRTSMQDNCVEIVREDANCTSRAPDSQDHGECDHGPCAAKLAEVNDTNGRIEKRVGD